MQAAHAVDSTPTVIGSLLKVAVELALRHWKVALQDDAHERPAIHTTKEEGAAERLAELVAIIEATKRKWQLAEPVRVVVLYEAGQDGFWIYRALERLGYEVVVTDPASIPVERQARRAKTDRLDALRLLSCLRGWLRGELDRLHAVRVPTPDDEWLRHLARERGQLQKEICQHRDRITKLLRTVGCWVQLKADFARQLEQGQIKCHDGSPLPAQLRERIHGECERLALAQAQFKRLETTLPKQLPQPVADGVNALQRLRGIGPVCSWRLMLELFWRNFNNARQVGSCVGLVPQPYDSGQSRVDQGISKQGNRRVRALLIEMAWMWLKHQPNSKLAHWYRARTEPKGGHPDRGKRLRRIVVVALARKLVIALWRYLKDGVMPEGATLTLPRSTARP
jgi:transposase